MCYDRCMCVMTGACVLCAGALCLCVVHVCCACVLCLCVVHVCRCFLHVCCACVLCLCVVHVCRCICVYVCRRDNRCPELLHVPRGSIRVEVYQWTPDPGRHTEYHRTPGTPRPYVGEWQRGKRVDRGKYRSLLEGASPASRITIWRSDKRRCGKRVR